MTSFTIFSDERLEGVADIINTINDSGNNVEVNCIWDAATGQLGQAAFAHHLVYPTDVVVVVVSILDLFNFDREVGLYIPWFTTVEAAVDHYVQTISHVLTELLSLPATPRVIFADLVGVDTLAWTPAFGDFAVQALADCIVPRGDRGNSPGEHVERSPRRSSRPTHPLHTSDTRWPNQDSRL